MYTCCNKSHTTGLSNGAVTVYSSGVLRAHPSGVRVSQYSVFCVLFCGLGYVWVVYIAPTRYRTNVRKGWRYQRSNHKP
jgi:hypothetical protein